MQRRATTAAAAAAKRDSAAAVQLRARLQLDSDSDEGERRKEPKTPKTPQRWVRLRTMLRSSETLVYSKIDEFLVLKSQNRMLKSVTRSIVFCNCVFIAFFA